MNDVFFSKPADLVMPSKQASGQSANQRSRNGCATCRFRKVKCDETRPICTRCANGKRECTWHSTAHEQPRKKRKIEIPTLSQYTYKPLPHHFPIPSSSASSPSASNTAVTKDTWHGITDLVPVSAKLGMLMDPIFLRSYFATLDQIQCFRAYISRCDDLLAFKCVKTPFNPWITHHAPLAFLKAAGQSETSEALKIALTAVGSVRLHYQAQPTARGLIIAHDISKKARTEVLSLLKPVMESNQELEQVELDTALAALLSCVVAGTLAADDGWNALLGKIMAFIDRSGGIPKMLERCPKDDYSVTRFVLEQLAVRDVVACMTTGRRPSVLKHGAGDWFLEIEKWSRRGIEWESSERMFGLSRSMVMVMARVCCLVAIVRERGQPISESIDFASLFHIPDSKAPSPTQPSATDDTDPDPFPTDVTLSIEDLLKYPYCFDLDTDTTSSSLNVTTIHTQPASFSTLAGSDHTHGINGKDHLKETADGLMADLGVFEYGTNWMPLHPRTQYGNHCYRHAMRIALLRDVYGVEHDDPRVVKSALAIIELGKELMVNFGHINWLSWPVLLAGFHIGTDKSVRKQTVDLLLNAGPHSCFDVHTGVSLLEQFWGRYDADEDAVKVRHWQVGEQLHQRLFAG